MGWLFLYLAYLRQGGKGGKQGTVRFFASDLREKIFEVSNYTENSNVIIEPKTMDFFLQSKEQNQNIGI